MNKINDDLLYYDTIQTKTLAEKEALNNCILVDKIYLDALEWCLKDDIVLTKEYVISTLKALKENQEEET